MLMTLLKILSGSWKTTLAGFVFGVLTLLAPSLYAWKLPTLEQWVIAAALTAMGMLGKDYDKTGTGSRSEPIRGADSIAPAAPGPSGFKFPDHGGDR